MRLSFPNSQAKITYQVYGLTLASSVAIQALSQPQRAPTTPDLHFEVGAIPDWAAHALTLPANSRRMLRPLAPHIDPSFRLIEYEGGLFFQLAYGDGTRFLADQDGTRIWGEPGPGLTEEDLLVYLLGPILGFVLRRRGRMALHASSVVIGDRAVALMGAAGVGKSTTAAALALRGWPVLCEDICALDESKGMVRVSPGYPRVCLWPDSVKFLFSSSNALPLIVSGWEKRFLALDGSRARFASNSPVLGAIYLLLPRSASSSAPHIEPVSQRDAALQLVQNTYMNYLLDKRQRAKEFDAISRVVSATHCFQVTPSSDPARLSAMAALIESHAVSLARFSTHPAARLPRSYV